MALSSADLAALQTKGVTDFLNNADLSVSEITSANGTSKKFNPVSTLATLQTTARNLERQAERDAHGITSQFVRDYN